ncbi:phage portal protein [Staphylococcus chromogenes]|uniref:phage portal protein n=1 Tax=Staphylococcus chromogenes TaxID=46126 RepID=UPI001FD17EB4|nr:phage portal protein [Staphylococcus chromogenes]
MDDVIYLRYNNENLEKYSLGLFEDYGEIFGRMINIQLLNNQIRGTLQIDATQFKSEESQKDLQGYIDMLFEAFKNNTIAVAPLTKGLTYEEHSGKGAAQGKQEFKNRRIKKNNFDRYCSNDWRSSVIGSRRVADLEKTINSYLKFCINPLLRKIESELNAKFFYPDEFLNDDKHIKVVGIDKRDPLQMSEAIDKLVSSGTFTRNQVRIMTGEEPANDPELRQVYYH